MAINVYTVTAERGPSGAWVLECDELGVVSQTRRLDQAEDEVAEAIAYQSGLQPQAFRIEVVPVLAPDIEGLRAQAEEPQTKADTAAIDAAAAKRALARTMKQQGFTVREMGNCRGVVSACSGVRARTPDN